VAGTLFVACGRKPPPAQSPPRPWFVFVVFAEWAVRGNPDMLVLPGGPLPGIGPVRTDSSVALHIDHGRDLRGRVRHRRIFGASRSVSAIIPVVWSAAAVFTPLALLIALYARIAHLDRSIPFAILAVILAAAYGAATETLARRDNRPGLPISIALFATGALGALALALTFALEKGWLTIALALMSMGTHGFRCSGRSRSCARWPPFLPASWCCASATSRASSAMRSARRRFQLASVGLRHSGAVVLGGSVFCAAAATTRRYV